MGITEDFLFSQGSLQDYVDCRRRFQLRYLRRVSWPAIQVEPALENERHLQRGAAFHRMIQQHLLGVPAERLSALLSDPAYGEDLRRWWEILPAARSGSARPARGSRAAPAPGDQPFGAAGRLPPGRKVRPDPPAP